MRKSFLIWLCIQMIFGSKPSWSYSKNNIFLEGVKLVIWKSQSLRLHNSFATLTCNVAFVDLVPLPSADASTYASHPICCPLSVKRRYVSPCPRWHWCISDLIRVFPLFGTTSKTLWCGHGVMYKVIPLVFTFYCWSLVLVSTHYSRADYCGKSQGFANHRQQGRLGSLFYSFFNLPQLHNYREPKIIHGSVSKKDSWPWQVKQ